MKIKCFCILVISCTLLSACRSSKVSSSVATASVETSSINTGDSTNVQRHSEEECYQIITIDSMEVIPYDDTIIEVVNGKAKIYGVKITSKGTKIVEEETKQVHWEAKKDSVSNEEIKKEEIKKKYPKWTFWVLGCIFIVFLITPMIWKKKA